MAQYRAKHRKWTEYGHATPKVTSMPGDAPNIQATVAPYLPTIRYDVFNRDFFVISAGTAVSLDSNNYIVPAGYMLDIAAEAASPGAGVIKYNQEDTDLGILGPDGVLVQAGQSVAATLIAEGITVGFPIAVLHSSVYMNPVKDYLAPADKGVGLGSGLPTRYRYHNYNLANNRAELLCDYVIEMPVAYSPGDVLFDNMVVYDSQGGTSLPKGGDLVGINAYSNWVKIDTTDAEVTAYEAIGNAIGQVIDFDARFPKGYLQYVQTMFSEERSPDSFGTGPFDFNDLDKQPGSATGGLSDELSFSGQDGSLGVIKINLIRM